MPADITVRRADPAEADLVRMLAVDEAARDWQIRNVSLIAYRLPL